MKPSFLLTTAFLAFATFAWADNIYLQHNLVSDIPGLADHLDPNLVNPWGISHSATSPFWVSDNKTGVSTLYNGSGVPQALVVTVPPPLGGSSPSAPTGQVFNGTGAFALAPNRPSVFLFATEDGTISGWNPQVNSTNAVLEVDRSGSGAVYKGLAIGDPGTGPRLYAANFHAGTIDVFDSNFQPVAGGFTDPGIPSGFAPFNVENFGGKLYVTYAMQDAAMHDDVAGSGNGYVDVYDLSGNLLQRLVSQGALDSPWGLAIAPSTFGAFGNDLLVGNFGDGRINAFDPLTGTLAGTLQDALGQPIAIDGLWALIFGNGGNGGSANTLFFTAGIPGGGAIEDHGLFGSLDAATPEPATWAMTLLGGMAALMARRRAARAR